MQFVSIKVNSRISYASDHADNVNLVEVESIGWEALNWMKMDENLHASGGPRKNLVRNDICGGLHMRHIAISHECHGWVAGELGFPQIGGLNNMWAPKHVRS